MSERHPWTVLLQLCCSFYLRLCIFTVLHLKIFILNYFNKWIILWSVTTKKRNKDSGITCTKVVESKSCNLLLCLNFRCWFMICLHCNDIKCKGKIPYRSISINIFYLTDNLSLNYDTNDVCIHYSWVKRCLLFEIIRTYIII